MNTNENKLALAHSELQDLNAKAISEEFAKDSVYKLMDLIDAVTDATKEEALDDYNGTVWKMRNFLFDMRYQIGFYANEMELAEIDRRNKLFLDSKS